MGSVFGCLSDIKQLTITMVKYMSIILMSILAVMTVSGQQNQYGIDVNNDGRIDRAEFHWANPDLDLYEEFGKLDLDKDGFIDQAEQQTNQEDESRQRLNRQRCFARCYRLFRLYDVRLPKCIGRC